ncbi:MAG: DUF3187 family protein [Gammaproteobacteria bacterium]|nr:DUF3187 family protein [Gammaproteobacteria bacterium]
MFGKSPNGKFCPGAFLCLTVIASFAIATNTSASQPFLTQDQNPFSLIHGQPQPVAARLPEAGIAKWSFTTDIANTLNGETNSTEKLLIDFESYNLRLAWLYALNQEWALKIDIPYIHYGGGFLDNTIDGWHDFFHLPRANRPLVKDNQFEIFYERNGQPLINLNTSNKHSGDIQLALGKSVFKQKDSALSLWLSADLATGESSSLTGNDSSDLSLWLAAEYQLAADWQTDINLGILFPGQSQLTLLEIADQVYFAYAGIEWQVHELVDLRIQLNGHSSFYDNSQLTLLGTAYSMVFGGRIHVTDCSDLDLAFSEDVQVGATPDISFLLSWRSQIDCQ